MKSAAGSRPMAGPGRPAGFVREEAIDAAMHLFWKRGFPSVSASDLAAAMSIQRSSFYNSFGTRAAVFREALRRYRAVAPDAALDHLQPGEPVSPALARALREICRARVADPEARGCMVCNGVAELVGVDKKVGPLVARAVTDRAAALERLLRQAAQQGEIPESADRAALADAVATFIMGLNAISKVIRDEARLWAMCEQFLAGLGISKDVIKAAGIRRPAARR